MEIKNDEIVPHLKEHLVVGKKKSTGNRILYIYIIKRAIKGIMFYKAQTLFCSE